MKQSRIKSKVPHSHKFHVNTKETLGGAIFKKRTPFLNNTLQDGQISPKLTRVFVPTSKAIISEKE